MLPPSRKSGRAGRSTSGDEHVPPAPRGKRARNLSLTPEAIARGEAYSAARGTTLSAVVEQFLRGLPAEVEIDDEDLDPMQRRRLEIEAVRSTTTSPLVRELYGLLVGSDLDSHDPRELHREHLVRRHGSGT